MKRTSLFVLVFALFFLCSCAGAYKGAYVTGTTIKTFVDETHEVYDGQARAKLAECDPDRNPKSRVETQSDMDDCMGPAFKLSTQDKIVQALAIYRTVAIAFTAVMLGCEPPEVSSDPEAPAPKVYAATCAKKTFTDAELRVWRGKLVDAALEALRSFPEADDKVKKLESLLGGL